MNELIDKVIEQIINDVNDGDLTALDELLQSVPKKVLENYLTDL